MNNDSVVEIVAIVDQSGSMDKVRDDTIGGFNAFLESQKELGGNANMTLVLFDDRYLVPIDGVALQDVAPLTRDTFRPLGWTAMNDAIGRAMTALEAKNPEKAIICILTDGQENASKEYTAEVVKAKIKAAEDRGWEVIFLAANIDAFAAGSGLGILGGNTYAFTASAQGVASAFESMTLRSSSYRSEPFQTLAVTNTTE